MLDKKCPECGMKLNEEMIEVNMCWDCGCILDKNLADEESIKMSRFNIEEFEEKEREILEKIEEDKREEKIALHNYILKKEEEDRLHAKELSEQQRTEYNLFLEKVDKHIVTTANVLEGYKIKEYKGIVSGDVVIGTGIFAESDAMFADIFGQVSKDYSLKIEKARKIALKNCVEKSVKLGGDAIIAIDFETVTFSRNMIGVSASGTSVKIEKKI